MGRSVGQVLGRWTSRGLSALGMLASVLMAPGLAAESITIAFPPLGNFVLTVKDIETFAKEGSPSPALERFVRLVPKENQEQLREALQESMQLSPKTVEEAVNSPLGIALFNRIGQVLRTADNQNGSVALKQAFVTAAKNPAGISILNVIRAFPSPTIQVEGQLGFKTLQGFVRVTENQNRVVAALAKSASASRSPAIPANLPNPAENGSYTWEKKSLTFLNPNRDNKPIPAELYLPKGLTHPTPLIVISHGLASDRFTFTYLAEHFASQGFPVAAITHPGSDSQRFKFFLSGTEIDYRIIPSDLVNRPLDIKYFLDTLSKTATPDWQINLNQVGVLGHSMGGYTALAVAGAGIDRTSIQKECNRIRDDLNSFNISALLQCRILGVPSVSEQLRDERVKAVVAINPIGSIIFGQAGISQIKIPTLIVAGSEDIFAPPLDEQFIPFTWLTTPDKYLAVMNLGTHFSVLQPGETGVFPVPNDLIGPDPTKAKPMVKGITSAFFQTYITPNPEFQGFLGQKFAGGLATNPFSLYMIRELTQAQINAAIAGGPTRP
ncbi:alpha/beta hydrolase [Synechococcus sp. PCC 6312]|uniref:alpha/beta hydrolase n=1 Tax=Synechococcus sp. (strain ATCC 27167 / PCC 6312) TaxID=195253 RepID=UPI00029F2EDA|nr:alpha/beta hydrolase [Synechococcus sp. PCC 6312]AFY59669.1 putative dienelactone hydrolase [Synechococcus sp. PCC 6312]